MMPETFDSIARRVVLDCLNLGAAAWWRKRAGDFEAVGTAACDEIAQACRNKARFIEMYGEQWPPVELGADAWPDPDATGTAILGEVA